MISLRREFIAALKLCKSYEQQSRDTKLLNSLVDSCCRMFWKEANSRRNEGHLNVEEVGTSVDEEG